MSHKSTKTWASYMCSAIRLRLIGNWVVFLLVQGSLQSPKHRLPTRCSFALIAHSSTNIVGSNAHSSTKIVGSKVYSIYPPW